jgi:hypothetical protein
MTLQEPNTAPSVVKNKTWRFFERERLKVLTSYENFISYKQYTVATTYYLHITKNVAYELKKLILYVTFI